MEKRFFTPEPRIIAHRGAPLEFPENTRSSFKRAIELGADVIETDVHFTRDKDFLVIHDDNILSSCGVEGRVADYTVKELKEFDAGYNFTLDNGNTFPFRGRDVRFLTLRDMLEEFPGQRFNIDLKDKIPEQVPYYADIIRECGAGHRVLTASEHGANNRLVRKEFPDMATSFSLYEALVFYMLFRSGLLFLKNKFKPDALQIPEFIGPSHLANESLVRMAHDRGLRVHVWTVNEEKDMRRLFDAGVDAIVSDDPALVKKVAADFF